MTIEDNNFDKPFLFLSADHFIENNKFFTEKLKKNKSLNENNIFIFGAKPSFPSTEYGYFHNK